MRKIKFRGINKRGEYVYGDLIHLKSRVYIAATHCLKYKVEPSSVAQFIGDDSNGEEVYEGDILIDKTGNIFVARLLGESFVSEMTLKT